MVRGPFGSVLAVEKDEMRILHSDQDDDLKAVRSGCTLGIVGAEMQVLRLCCASLRMTLLRWYGIVDDTLGCGPDIVDDTSGAVCISWMAFLCCPRPWMTLLGSSGIELLVLNRKTARLRN